MWLEIRQMTGEVIKTGTTSTLSLGLNINHAANLDMWMCRHIWISWEEASACCLTLWLFIFWQEPLKCGPSGMDNGLSHSGTVLCRLSAVPSDRRSSSSLHYTSLLFSPREVLASGQPSLSVRVTGYVLVCLCVWILCGSVGSTCSLRAMLINALQTKCSLLRSPPLLPSSANLSCPLSGHCWERWRWGRWCCGTGRGAGGKCTNKAEYKRKYTSGLRQRRALPPSPSCLLCLMLGTIDIPNSKLRLKLSHSNHIHNSPTFTIFGNESTRRHWQAHLITRIQMLISHAWKHERLINLHTLSKCFLFFASAGLTWRSLQLSPSAETLLHALSHT